MTDGGQDIYDRIASTLRNGVSFVIYSRVVGRVLGGLSLLFAVIGVYVAEEVRRFTDTVLAVAPSVLTSNATIVTVLLVNLVMTFRYRGPSEPAEIVVRTRLTVEPEGSGDRSGRDEPRADGGDRPRDDKGRFKSDSDSVAGDLILAALATAAGFAFFSQFGSVEAIAGATGALALFILLNNPD
jgi:hypothetical protein